MTRVAIAKLSLVEQGAVVEASDGESAEDLADAVEEAGYGASAVD